MNAPKLASLSVVMPLYNEGAQITANVEQTVGVLRMLGPVRTYPGQRWKFR